MVEELNYFALCFTSSVEAKEYILEEIKSGTISLIIVQMMMTGISGMQLMQEIRAVHAHMPFLLTSSFSKGEKEREGNGER